MMRMKQNKYPVMFLTQGQSTKYEQYNDPRCWSILAATQYASMIEILGINVHTEDILKDPAQVGVNFRLIVLELVFLIKAEAYQLTGYLIICHVGSAGFLSSC